MPVADLRPAWRPWLVALVLALTAGVGAGSWFLAPRLRAAREWDVARTALDDDDFPTARRALRICRNLWPNNPDVCVALTRLEERAGDLSGARAHLHDALRLGLPPDRVEFEQLLLNARGGAIAASASRLELIGKGDSPDAALAREALVQGWIQVRAIPEAHVACDAWIARFPEDWRARYWLGWVLESEGYNAFAAEEYRRASAANPGNIDVRFRLAETLLNMSDFPRALPHLDTCVAARPEEPAIGFARARCLQALGRAEEAEAALKTLVTKNPQHGAACLLLARLYLGRDDAAAAVDYARRAALLDPNNPVPAATLAEALRGVQSREADRWEERARTLTEQNERVASLSLSAKYHPRDVELRYQLGTLLMSLGRGDEAVRWFRAALAIDPNHLPTRQALANLTGQVGGPSSRTEGVSPVDSATRPTSP
jgi:tetratricopeptide (TPR) repeat protein